MSGREIASRNRGVYAISDLEVARLLNVPAGQHVVALSMDWPSSSLLILVEGEGLPEVYEGGTAPYLNQHGQLRSMADWNRCDVAGFRSADAHAAVLAELGAVRFEDPQVRAGRRRILERHAPRPEAPWQSCCSSCVSETDGSPDDWPCLDYLDAATGLVVGLIGQAHYEATLTDAAARFADNDGAPLVTEADLAMLRDPATGEALDRLVLGEQAAPDAGAEARPGVETEPRRHRRTPPATRTAPEE